MTPIIHEVTLEVSKPNLFQAIMAKQGDAGSRFLKAKFIADGKDIAIPSDASVMINALRTSDGRSNSFEGEINEDSTVTVPLHEWMLNLEGIVQSDVSIIKGDKTLTSTSFNINVEKAANVDNISDVEIYSFFSGESTVFRNPYLTKFCYRALRSNTWITGIDCPKVTEVGEEGFKYCTALTSINLPACEVLKTGAFYQNSVTHIDMPSLITAGNSAFRDNTALESINLPKVETIDSACFDNCAALKSIVLPSIKSLGGNVFKNCNSLEYIILSGENVCALAGHIFSADGVGTAFKGVYVRDELVDQYKTATNWARYADYIKPRSELPEVTA